MRALRRLRHIVGRGRLALRTKVRNGISSVGWLIFSVIPEPRIRRALDPLLGIAFIGRWVSLAYSRLLKICSYRCADAEWLQRSFERLESPRRGFDAAYASVAAWDYEAARKICERLKVLVARRKVKGEDLATILRIELVSTLDQTKMAQPLEALCRSQSDLGEFFYQRAWLAHSMRATDKVERSLRTYLPAVDFAPDAVEHVVEHLYAPNGMWREALWAVQQSLLLLDRRLRTARMDIGTKRKLAEQRDRLNGLRLNAATNLGDLEVMQTSVKEGWQLDPTFLFSRSQSEEMQGKSAEAIATLQQFIALKKVSNREKAIAYGILGIFHEEQRQFDTARLYYSESYRHGGVPGWFPEYLWRYVSALMAVGDWDEAVYVLRQGMELLWLAFRDIAKRPFAARLKSGDLIPSGGAFILGCQGIGDDVLRLAIFLEERNPEARYGFTCDPRLAKLLSNAMPDVEFLSNSAVTGSHRTDERTYLRDRDGVKSHLDPARLTTQTLLKIREYPEAILSEDLLHAFMEKRGAFRRTHSKPVLKPSDDVTARVRELLSALPPGRLNVGISWRSGHRDYFRNKCYSTLPEWKEIFAVPGVNFVNLQYLYEQDELDEAEALHGVKIHTLPGIDLKDDMEEVAALCVLLDSVIAPGTALREISAGAGARTYSISSTPYYPDLYRTDEQRRDVIFPNMQHVTAYEYGSTDGVLAEIGRRVAEDARHARIQET